MAVVFVLGRLNMTKAGGISSARNNGGQRKNISPPRKNVSPIAEAFRTIGIIITTRIYESVTAQDVVHKSWGTCSERNRHTCFQGYVAFLPVLNFRVSKPPTMQADSADAGYPIDSLQPPPTSYLQAGSAVSLSQSLQNVLQRPTSSYHSQAPMRRITRMSVRRHT